MNEKREKESENWRDLALHFAVGTMRELGNTVLRSFYDKIDRAVASIIRKLLSALLLSIGLVFLLIGLAEIIGELMGGSSSVGYVIVGAISIMIAMVMSLAKGEKM